MQDPEETSQGPRASRFTGWLSAGQRTGACCASREGANCTAGRGPRRKLRMPRFCRNCPESRAEGVLPHILPCIL